MTYCIREICFVIFIITLIFNLGAEYKEKKCLRWITKPLIVPLIAVIYLFSDGHHSSLVISALFFSFAGDVFLMWSDKKSLFISGLLSFLIAHICYVLFISPLLPPFDEIHWFYWLLLMLLVVYGCLLLFFLRHYLKKMQTAVVIYAGVLLGFFFVTMIFAGHYATRFGWMSCAGSFLFVVSDSVLAWHIFRGGIPRAGVWYMSSYAAAQLLISQGLLLQS